MLAEGQNGENTLYMIYGSVSPKQEHWSNLHVFMERKIYPLLANLPPKSVKQEGVFCLFTPGCRSGHHNAGLNGHHVVYDVSCHVAIGWCAENNELGTNSYQSIKLCLSILVLPTHPRIHTLCPPHLRTQTPYYVLSSPSIHQLTHPSTTWIWLQCCWFWTVVSIKSFWVTRLIKWKIPHFNLHFGNLQNKIVCWVAIYVSCTKSAKSLPSSLYLLCVCSSFGSTLLLI